MISRDTVLYIVTYREGRDWQGKDDIGVAAVVLIERRKKIHITQYIVDRREEKKR